MAYSFLNTLKTNGFFAIIVEFKKLDGFDVFLINIVYSYASNTFKLISNFTRIQVKTAPPYGHAPFSFNKSIFIKITKEKTSQL